MFKVICLQLASHLEEQRPPILFFFFFVPWKNKLQSGAPQPDSVNNEIPEQKKSGWS